MAEVDYSNMDGLQVLWHLLTTEPFFWVLLGIGFVALGFSLCFDRYVEQDDKHVVADQSENLYR